MQEFWATPVSIELIAGIGIAMLCLFAGGMLAIFVVNKNDRKQ